MPSENMKRYYMDYEESKQLIIDGLTKKTEIQKQVLFQ
jgi:hypothetical protein